MNIPRVSYTLALNALIILFPLTVYSQAKIGFVSTQTIRERSPEYKTAQQRLDAVTSDWKREMDELQNGITALEQDIQRKRLIWTDAERREKDSLLLKKKREKEDYVRRKFNAGGEFDTLATNYLRPVETKITAAVQDVAASDGYDIILDKATQPLLVANPRYDITVKVMEKLGIYADDLKAKQKEAMDKEDRQRQEQRRTTPTRRRPTKTTTDSTEIKQPDTKEIPEKKE